MVSDDLARGRHALCLNKDVVNPKVYVAAQRWLLRSIGGEGVDSWRRGLLYSL